VSVAVKKLDGVESVTVSLEAGTADIRLRPGNVVSLQRIRRLIRNSGFTPKQAEVTAVGKKVAWEKKPAFEVSKIGVVYLLEEDPDHPAAMSRLSGAGEVGGLLVAEGTVSEEAEGTERLRLRRLGRG